MKWGLRGQASVEYLIVGIGLLALIIGIGALAHVLQDGLFVQHAAQSASHAASSAAGVGVLGDVILY